MNRRLAPDAGHQLTDERFNEVLTVIERCAALPVLERMIVRPTGRPRTTMTVKGLFFALQAVASLPHHRMYVLDGARLLNGLTPSQRQQLDIAWPSKPDHMYRRLYRLFDTIARLLEAERTK
jgi:hypothetical protein